MCDVSVVHTYFASFACCYTEMDAICNVSTHATQFLTFTRFHDFRFLSAHHACAQALSEAAVLAAHAVAAVDVTATLGQARQLRRLPVLGAADEETLATQHEQLHVECQG